MHRSYDGAPGQPAPGPPKETSKLRKQGRFSVNIRPFTHSKPNLALNAPNMLSCANTRKKRAATSLLNQHGQVQRAIALLSNARSTSPCATSLHRSRQHTTSYIPQHTCHTSTRNVSSQILERHLRHNGIIELHMKKGAINYFNILQFAAQHINDSEHSETQRIKDNVYNKSFENNFDNYSKRRRRLIGGECQFAAQCADIEHKQSQSLLQHQALAHQAQRQPPVLKTSKEKKEGELDIMMEGCKTSAMTTSH